VLRCDFLQTIEQYVFIYKALINELASRIKGSSSNSSGDGGGSANSSGSNALAAAPPSVAATTSRVSGAGSSS
jgi:hypothetical protein